MDRQHPFLTQLRQVIQTVNDDALAAMGSHGLLRRARKDVAKQTPRITHVGGQQIELAVDDHVVVVPPLPTMAQCDCAADEVCRHIIGSLLFLRDHVATESTFDEKLALGETTKDAAEPLSAAEPDTSAALLQSTWSQVAASLDLSSLRAWAGTALLRKALSRIDLQIIEIADGEGDAAWTARFPSRQVSVHWLPGNGLEGFVCSCHASPPCEHVVQAVLVDLQRNGHIDFQAADWLQFSRPEQSGAPQSRAAVYATVQSLVSDFVRHGLARLNPSIVHRLTTLSVSAHGADLPRLERELAALGDTVDRLLRREAGIANASVIMIASRVNALVTALNEKETLDLVGQHRSEYADVGTMSLAGVGAEAWQTSSGYRGLSIYFWSDDLGRWFTWSESRPVLQKSFSPHQVYHGPGPWEGCLSPRQACRNVWQLNGVWRNRDGRISGRASTRSMLARSRSLAEHGIFVEDWCDVARRLRSLNSGSLTTNGAASDLVVLRPKNWEPCRFEEIRQELSYVVRDKFNRPLTVRLRYQSDSNALETFEALGDSLVSESGDLLGRIRLSDRQLWVEPTTVFFGDRTINLGLDPNPHPKQHHAAVHAPSPTSLAKPSHVSQQFSQSLACLEAIAERGTQGVRGTDDILQLQALAQRFDQLGVSLVAASLRRFVKTLRRARDGDQKHLRDAALHLLETHYIVALVTQQEAVDTACELYEANK